MVAIVGRPNVGKSALFNRIAGKQIALVYDRAGVTRDRVMKECVWRGHHFMLWDTGGIGLEDASGLEKEISREVEIAIEGADDIILVVDGREGLQILDEEVARKLRRSKRRVYVAVNKIDSGKQADLESDFLKLGDVYPVSAAHGKGVDILMKEIAPHWEKVEEKKEIVEKGQTKKSEIKEEKGKRTYTRVAIVGKPNVGKSSLVNAILNKERLIVSNVPGTTRDAVDVYFNYKGREYCLVDTAGMRKKQRISDSLENAMTGRSAHTINRADVCVLVIDSESGVGEQEKRIAGLIQKAEKPCVVLINKWDLAEDIERKERDFRRRYEEAARCELFFAPYASVLFTSALKGKNISHLFEEIHAVLKGRDTKIGTGELNRILQRAMEQQSPPRKGKRSFKIYYATQGAEENSAPTILAFVNYPKMFSEDYRRYLEQVLRKKYPLRGCPIKWVLREHRKKKE